MTNKLSDLNNHLFAQLDRMATVDMTPEQIETEVKRLMEQSGADNATESRSYAEQQAPDAAQIAAQPTQPISGQGFRWQNS